MTDRQLDALVVKHVMGWENVSDGALAGNFSGKGHDAYALPPMGYVAKIPHYSTTGRGMLAVIEKMRERKFMVGMRDHDADATWRVAFESRESADHADADTLPRAVAIAALRALGVEVPS